jgi:hypothetical protein
MPPDDHRLLKKAIREMQGCDSYWLESVKVGEHFQGQPTWDTTVDVFALVGHPQAKLAYAPPISQVAIAAHSGAMRDGMRVFVSVWVASLVGPKWCEIRQVVFGWTEQRFRFSVKTAHALKIREPHVITVTGKAFYDIGHAPVDHSNRRSMPKDYAVWEIHPVMKMELIP